MKKAISRIEKHDPLSNSAGSVRGSLVEQVSEPEAAHWSSADEQKQRGREQPGRRLKSTADGVQATLRLRNPTARRVFVAGNFNDWRVDASPLQKAEKDEWTLDLTLTPGAYEYRFVVDGQWCDDPLAKERVKNPHGGWNAVLRVGARIIQLPEHLPQ